MSKQEHRVSVDNGKYTFVIPATDYRVSILRHGEPWHGPQGEASNALHSIMCELDAARVVLQAARALCDALDKLPLDAAQVLAKCCDAPLALVRALALHDRLVDDQQAPSPWCGVEYARRAAEVAERIDQDRATYRAFKDIDDASTVEALEALWRQLDGKLGHSDHDDAQRRYHLRMAQLESQA